MSWGLALVCDERTASGLGPVRLLEIVKSAWQDSRLTEEDGFVARVEVVPADQVDSLERWVAIDRDDREPGTMAYHLSGMSLLLLGGSTARLCPEDEHGFSDKAQALLSSVAGRLKREGAVRVGACKLWMGASIPPPPRFSSRRESSVDALLQAMPKPYEVVIAPLK